MFDEKRCKTFLMFALDIKVFCLKSQSNYVLEFLK